MMKHIYDKMTGAAAVIAVALGISSCLEKLPGDAIMETESMKTFNDAFQTRVGIYSAYTSGALYSGYLTLMPDIQTDLVHAVQGNTNTYVPLWQWDIRPTNSEITAVYGSLYKVIARCNFYLDQVGDLRESLVNDDEITQLDQYTGEVYCARANAYAELIKCFCEAYDPEMAHEQKGVALDSTYFGAKPSVRSSLKESYDFVLRDLDRAVGLLDEENDFYTNPAITQAAAYALLARVSLYMQNWDDAIKYSTKVIDNKAFELATASVYTTGTDPIQGGQRYYTFVDYMWTHDLSREVIWQVGMIPTSYGGALGSVFLNFENDFVYFYPDYMPSEWVVGLYDPTDARRSAYFRTLPTGYTGNPNLTLLIKYFGNEAEFIPNKIYHVSQPKPFRLAEQYLIRAEAYCRKESPNHSLAGEDIRTLASSRAAKVKTINNNNWLDVISEERVKELYMEGFRLQDLKRWAHLDEWTKINGTTAFKREMQSSAQNGFGSTLKIETGDYRFVWPIPKHEIEAPGSSLTQNKGY